MFSIPLVFYWIADLFPLMSRLYTCASTYILIVRMGLEGPGLTVSQKIWYCIATVGGQYIWARLQSFSAFRRWGDTEQVLLISEWFNSSSYAWYAHDIWCNYIWMYLLKYMEVSPFWNNVLIISFVQRSLARRGWFILQRIEGFYKAASFGNLLIFLLTGR